MIFQDTIAAIATPIGESGVGIIRISGDNSKEIAQKILRSPKGEKYTDLKHFQVYYGKVIDPSSENTIDEVLFFYAQGPKSFTAEDVVEIHAHGGMLLLAKVLNICLQNGARLAEPGEFTKRAFLNGRIDLIQAEGIIDLIRAKTEKAHELAIAQLTGRSTRNLAAIEEELYNMLVAIEASLDFPEEALPEVEHDRLVKKTTDLLVRLKKLGKTIDEGRKIREGITIAILGKPNVGKSSLLNLFLEEEKAIVTDIPGTTRDIIEATIQMRGIPLTLVDTAGIRYTENKIEQIGIQKAEELISKADLGLLLLDASEALNPADYLVLDKISSRAKLVVLNKADLPEKIDLPSLQGRAIEVDTLVRISAKTGFGFDSLEEKIVEMLGLGELRVDDRPLLSRLRHQQAIEKAILAIESYLAGLQNKLSEDLLAVDLRAALEALGEITGKKVTKEVLDNIFAQFCIGK